MKIATFIASLLVSCFCSGQKRITIHTADIDHFWTAYDSVKTTDDSARQLAYVQNLYLDKATDGLKDFMAARNHSAVRHLNNIKKYAKFWESIRPKTEGIKNSVPAIESVFDKYKSIYPDFAEPEIYFTIGVLNSGGTTAPGRILIGAEIACADNNTDASELNAWLKDVFRLNDGIVAMVAHEIGHTQQKGGDGENDGNSNLLGYCLKEGMCDFFAELAYREISSPYMTYGKKNEKAIWQKFQKEMLTQDIKNWLYNGSDAPNGVADLGYFVGYEICRAYYKNAKDKKQALTEILQLEYDPKSVSEFLKKSRYDGK